MTSRVWSVSRLLEEGAKSGPILGIATGTPKVSIGLVADGRIRASLTRALPSHCAGLPAVVDEMVGDAGLNVNDLRGIGVGLGPGSFTGLRVGLSYAKGLAIAGRLPLAGIPTLDAMALLASSADTASDMVCPIIDARRGEVYAALYQFMDDALERRTDDLALTIAELGGLIDRETTVIGEARASEVQKLALSRGYGARLLGTAELCRTGSMVAVIAAAQIAQNKADEVATLEPRYVRGTGAMRPTLS